MSGDGGPHETSVTDSQSSRGSTDERTLLGRGERAARHGERLLKKGRAKWPRMVKDGEAVGDAD